MEKVKWLDQFCNQCSEQLNSWDIRLSKTLAYRYPVCESCIAKEYLMEVEELRGMWLKIYPDMLQDKESRDVSYYNLLGREIKKTVLHIRIEKRATKDLI